MAKQRTTKLQTVVSGMETIQYLLGFMDNLEHADEQTLLYVLKNVDYLRPDCEDKDRRMMLDVTRKYITELLTLVYMDIEEAENLARKHWDESKKECYITKYATRKGDSGKEYYTIGDTMWAKQESIGTCNDHGITEEIPAQFGNVETVNVPLGYTTENTWKGEIVSVDGLKMGVIRLHPDKCKKKAKRVPPTDPLKLTHSKEELVAV